MDMMMENMGNLMERLSMDNRPSHIENQEKHNRNHIFKRPLPPRNQGIPEDRQIMPPFLDSYVVEEGGEDPMENQDHHFDDIDFRIFLIEEEHNFFAQEEDDHISEKKPKENEQPT